MLNRSRDPRGAVSIFALLLAGAVYAFIGLIWDGGTLINNYRNANQLAAEAGRAAAQCVDVNNYLTTGVATVHDVATATNCMAPLLQLVEHGDPTAFPPIYPEIPSGTTVLSAVASFPDGTGDEIQVTVTLQEPVLFLVGPKFGFANTVTGQATVKLETGVTDSGG